MANQIILPAQQVNLPDLVKSFPKGKFKKIFFQCELKKIVDGNAVFGIVVYVGKKSVSQTWDIGKKVECTTDDSAKPQQFTLPVAFGNSELSDFNFARRMKKKAKITAAQKQQFKLLKALKKIQRNKKELEKASLGFTARVTDNPHLEFDVTLTTGSGSVTAPAKPSPPAPPEP